MRDDTVIEAAVIWSFEYYFIWGARVESQVGNFSNQNKIIKI